MGKMKKSVISIIIALVGIFGLSSCGKTRIVSGCYTIQDIEIDTKNPKSEIKLSELGGFRPGDRVKIIDNKLTKC